MNQKKELSYAVKNERSLLGAQISVGDQSMHDMTHGLNCIVQKYLVGAYVASGGRMVIFLKTVSMYTLPS